MARAVKRKRRKPAIFAVELCQLLNLDVEPGCMLSVSRVGDVIMLTRHQMYDIMRECFNQGRAFESSVVPAEMNEHR